jgi:hypothetical protein
MFRGHFEGIHPSQLAARVIDPWRQVSDPELTYVAGRQSYLPGPSHISRVTSSWTNITVI